MPGSPLNVFLHMLRRWLLICGAPLGLVLWLLPQYLVLAHGWSSLHAVLEITAVSVAVMIFMVGWNAHILNRSIAGAQVGVLFLLVAMLDTAHLLSFPGMPDWLTPSGDAKSITFWLAARLVAACGLYISASLDWSRPGTDFERRGLLTLSLCTGVFMVPGLAGVAFLWPTLFWDTGGLTVAKVISEAVIIGLMLAALVQEMRRYRTPVPYERSSMMFALLTMIAAEACFVGYFSTSDATLLIGHVYKAIGYILLYRTLVVGIIREPYRRLHEAESVASHTRDQLQSVFMASPDGVILVNSEGLIILANPRFTELTGYREEEVKGLSVDILLPERFRKQHPDMMRNYLSTPTVRPMASGRTLSARRRDGTEFPIDVALSPLLRDGETCVVATLRDVSERVGMMRQLVDSEARIRGFLDNSVDWVWETDPAGVLTYSSQRVLDVLGYAPSAILGRSLTSLMSDADAIRLGPQIREIVMRREPLLHLEHRSRYQGGGERLLESNGTPHFSPDGQFLGYRGVTRDVTEQRALQVALEKSERLFRHAFDDFPNGMAMVDQHGKILRANDFLRKLLGYSRGELEQTVLADLFMIEKRWEQVQEILALCDGRKDLYDREVMLLDAAGQIHWVRLAAARVETSDNDASPLLLMITDISAAKDAANHNERLLTIIERMGDSVGVVDRNGKVLYVNPYARAMLGIDQAEDLSQTHISDYHPADTASFLQERVLPLAERNGVWEGETLWLARSGEQITTWQVVMAHKDVRGNVEYWTTVARDIRERRRMEAQLSHQASHDALTGLPNRVLLNDRLQQAISLARRERKLMAVAFIDLDNFKRINDTLGHSVGDQVLLALAQRLGECLRSSDTLARQGGDEFIALLPSLTTVSDVIGVLDKMVAVLNKAVIVRDREIFVTASIGVSIYPFDHDSADELLRKADVAMYRAKERGRNGYQFYTSDMDEGFKVDLQLEAELRHAIENNELVLHYQPQYRLDTLEVTGFEALVRWRHPQRGLMPPGDFIPMAERSMLIAYLGEWVLREVCRQIKDWQQRGFTVVPVAFNLSAPQFEYMDVARLLRTVLAEAELEGETLELEITEGVLMRDPVATARTLAQIKALGIRIAVDDFGTGYSSLGYLKQFPVDVLKIDRSFVMDVANDSDDAGIVRAIISMAHNLEVGVVAEGVETEAQLAFLRQSACDYGQGYLFNRPLPAAEAEHSLASAPFALEVLSGPDTP